MVGSLKSVFHITFKTLVFIPLKGQRLNAEWALKQQMDALLLQFEQIEDDYLRERKADVVQVVERVLKALLGHSGRMPPRPLASARGTNRGARAAESANRCRSRGWAF